MASDLCIYSKWFGIDCCHLKKSCAIINEALAVCAMFSKLNWKEFYQICVVCDTVMNKIAFLIRFSSGGAEI